MMSKLAVMEGARAGKGDVIGYAGSTGRSTGPHLFFGVRWHDARIDPTFLLEAPAKIPSVDVTTPPAGQAGAMPHAGSKPGRKR